MGGDFVLDVVESQQFDVADAAAMTILSFLLLLDDANDFLVAQQRCSLVMFAPSDIDLVAAIRIDCNVALRTALQRLIVADLWATTVALHAICCDVEHLW